MFNASDLGYLITRFENKNSTLENETIKVLNYKINRLELHIKNLESKSN